MRVLIYRGNDDIAFADDCRAKIEMDYPEAKVREINARFFDPNSMDKGDVIYVRAGLTTIRNAYSKRDGVTVHAISDVAPTIPVEPERLKVTIDAESGTATVTDEPEEPFTDEHEPEVMALLALSIAKLKEALKTTPKVIARKALKAEQAGRNRSGCVALYKKALK